MQRDSHQNFQIFDQYVVKKKTFNQQFAQLYSSRLKTLRPRIKQAVSKKYQKKYEIIPILEVKSPCILIGTFFKEMKAKPNLLKQYTQEIDDIDDLEAKEPADYMSPTDRLFLEDEHGRIQIKFSENENENPNKLSVHQFVTGMVVGCLGSETSGGFLVEDVILPECPVFKPETKIKKGKEEYICLISGVQIGNPESSRLRLQLFMDYVLGLAPKTLDDDETQDSSQKAPFSSQNPIHITRTIFVGESIVDASDFLEKKKEENFTHVRGSLRTKDTIDWIEPCKEFDSTIKQLLDTMYVDVMPGENDPTNIALPQEKLPRFMFPESAPYKSFRTVSNPYSFEINGHKWMGTSGQNITNITKFTNVKDIIDAMDFCLKCNHLAPSAPDTVDCYAFTGGDQLVIDSLPQVFFAGNQQKYASRLDKEKNILMVTVPSFAKTGQFVLVNTKTLESIPINVGITI